MDRRLIDERIEFLKKRLAHVKKVRAQQKAGRKRTTLPTIALVGYTNAGKSSLFNVLANEHIYAKNQLFATLDTTLRKVKLNKSTETFISDTVGFVTDLPHELVEAFKATLDEVIEADVLLFVSDIASTVFQQQHKAVMEVLHSLGVDEQNKSILHVWNKADLLTTEDRFELEQRCQRLPQTILISTQTGYGIEELRTKLLETIECAKSIQTYRVKYENAEAINWLHTHGEVLQEKFTPIRAILKVRISEKHHDIFVKRFTNPSL